MKLKHRSNSKQTIKLHLSRDSLPKLSVCGNNGNKENNQLSSGIAGVIHHIDRKSVNNKLKRGESMLLISSKSDNINKVADHIQNLISLLMCAKIYPQQQTTLISSLTSYLILLKDCTSNNKFTVSNLSSNTLKKSKFSFSTINGKKNQLQLSCSQMKIGNQQKYSNHKINITTGNKQLNNNKQENNNLSMVYCTNSSNKATAQSKIHKQKYKPAYFNYNNNFNHSNISNHSNSYKLSLDNDKTRQNHSLLSQDQKKTQLQQQHIQTIDQYKQQNKQIPCPTTRQNDDENSQSRVSNNKQKQQHNKTFKILSSQKIQKGRLYHTVKTQVQEHLESELVIGNWNQEKVVGRQKKQKGIKDINDENITFSNDKKNMKKNPEPNPQPNTATAATTRQPVSLPTDDNLSLYNEELQILRILLKQRQSQIISLWMIINQHSSIYN